jgi:hypothetical protein
MVPAVTSAAGRERSMKRLFALVGTAMAVLVLAASPAHAAVAWSLGTVDTADQDSPPSSITVSPTGDPWVAWVRGGTDDLWWAGWDGVSWDKTQVAGVGSSGGCYLNGAGPAAGFDPVAGTPGIASWCHATGAAGPAILWTHREGNGWATDAAGSGPAPTECSYRDLTNVGLAFDPAIGDPQLGYGSDTGEVHWLHRIGETWMDELVAVVPQGCNANGPGVSIAVSPFSGAPAMAWVTGFFGDLMYAEYDPVGASWSTPKRISGKAFGTPSLAFSPSGVPWVAFPKGNLSQGHLQVAYRPGASWTQESVDAASVLTGLSPSLAFRGSAARIASYDPTNGRLRFAARTGTSWSLQTVDGAGDVGAHPSLAFAGLDPYLSYWDAANLDLRWARPSS